jgi:hypothetical protein
VSLAQDAAQLGRPARHFAAFQLLVSSRLSVAVRLCIYYTVPFAALDAWYCGIHLGHGAGFLHKYWYLSVFYITPWLTFIPIAMLLGKDDFKPNKRAPNKKV